MTLDYLIGLLTEIRTHAGGATEVRIDNPHSDEGFSIDEIYGPGYLGQQPPLLIRSDDLDRVFDPPADFNP